MIPEMSTSLLYKEIACLSRDSPPPATRWNKDMVVAIQLQIQRLKQDVNI